MATGDYKPEDCGPPCKYPAATLPTGSGHHKDCLAHQRWVANGRTWRAPSPENAHRHTAAAVEIVELLEDHVERMNDREREFIEDMRDRLDRFGERTFVSDAQMNWLRKLEETYLI